MTGTEIEMVKTASMDLALLEEIDVTLKHEGSIPSDSMDSSISTWLVSRVFKSRISWNKEFGWMAFHSGVWNRVTIETITEIVRRAHDSIYRRFLAGGAGGTAIDGSNVRALLSASRIRAVVFLLAGQVEIPADKFDQRADLLNTPSGVVVLSTRDVLPPDPSFLFTKITNVGYAPGARHADIDELMSCLPDEERRWMLDRIGQAVNGTPPDESTLTLLVGFGANGKTSLTHAANLVLGSFFGRIPVSVLSSTAKSGPNDNMTLRGVRMAVIEEFPEGHTLSNRNLKEIIGTPVIQGRFLFKEWVTWEATHTLFVTTNELPRVDETDHGTWRRFDVVSFPYRYVNGTLPLAAGDKVADPKLLTRIASNESGQLQALLAMIVESASNLLAPGKTEILPTAQMALDKEAWRERSDKIYSFVGECVEFDEMCHVSISHLYFAYSSWMESQGNKPLSQPNFVSKFLEHQSVRPQGLEKMRIRSGQSATTFNAPPTLQRSGINSLEPQRYTAVRGLRFKS